MTKKERKKLNRVKAIRKMKNANPNKKINPFKNVFDKMFVENDYLKELKVNCDADIESAKLLNDVDRVNCLLSAKSDLQTASIEVKDNVATINFPNVTPMIFSYDNKSMTLDDGNGEVCKLAA